MGGAAGQLAAMMGGGVVSWRARWVEAVAQHGRRQDGREWHMARATGAGGVQVASGRATDGWRKAVSDATVVMGGVQAGSAWRAGCGVDGLECKRLPSGLLPDVRRNAKAVSGAPPWSAAECKGGQRARRCDGRSAKAVSGRAVVMGGVQRRSAGAPL
ncbi:hypothetical protein CYMTET_20048 [Cymbomonas tetramitiformis]|uniref:Uncharacterized protein n=1 Tax=Cymbomonas tetramitiformis TaxID=36881 RepID=A0AAE0L4M3_9CHLO|nr:hypothetical protein CYMTET_20048 [Cymbomonas tetramitiformis]